MSEHDWRKPNQKKAAKQATTATAKSSDWKRGRKVTAKGNAHVSKAAWAKNGKRSA
jgi:hypothetical protein